tara:strand:- start:668 stop:1348 length:681 start_codon:yes stop_codon:yes gene_type:complete
MIRVLDILISLFAIIVLSPLFIVLVLLLKFSGEGEIFYFQNRVGTQSSTFKLIKFATMLKHSSSFGTKEITVKDDPRILPLGRILRKTKINELPQLFNIFVGDMSLVGPRPLALSGYEKYPERQKKDLQKIKPGLSGLASLILRNEEEILSHSSSPVDFHSNILTPFKGEIEIWFSERHSIANYFKIIFLTIWIVVFSGSKILEKVYKNRPQMPEELKDIMRMTQK